MKLSIVATPIGNLEDITLRALRTLRECSVIYAEDTRVIAKLLAHYEIKKTTKRLDAATEARAIEEICERLVAGDHVVLVSDAGTPGISDPGARLVAGVREKLPSATIEAIPGPSSLAAALSIAGVNATEFTFVGFLPHKKGRQTSVRDIIDRKHPTVLFESPHRIEKLLVELASVSARRVTIARELTKIHEEVLSGTPEELSAHFRAHPDTVRGEFVVIIEP